MASSTLVYQYTGLYVRVSEAKKIPSRDVSGHPRNPFCIVKIDNETVARTANVFKTLEPFWGEEYNLHVPNEFQAISVYMFDYDSMGSKEPLGKVMLTRPDLVKNPRGIDKWFPLTPIHKDDEVQGEVLVEMNIEQFGEDVFRLLLTVVEARDLVGKSDGKADPFAVVHFGEEQHQTQVMTKTRFPRWRKTFDISFPKPLVELKERMVKIVVYDWDKFLHNKFMGEVEIDLSELMVGQRYKTWYRLQHQEHKQKDKKKELGSLRLKVQCSEERILEVSLYDHFVKLMLDAVDNPTTNGSPLLVMLEEVMTMDRNSLAHTLVRFFLAHGSVIPFLDALTVREVTITSDTRTLFRGNSLASKAFDQFMKVVALPFLHETLSSAIDMVYTDHRVCELDIEQLRQSSKVKSDSVCQKTVEMSINILSFYVDTIMHSIVSSVDHCPKLMRLALRQLWLRVAERFKDPEHVDVPYLAITGFLFLRFFVPAILSPKLFALRDEHPDQKTERTLKLIAKVLQSIGNLSPEMDAKEAYMQPMSAVLADGVRRVKEYIQDLVQLDQKQVTVETGAKDGGYIHHLILCRGWLWKRSSNTSAVSSIQYRKRFFELSNMALTYTQNEKQTGEVKSYPVHCIKVVEKVDEGAFHRKHMFQVVIVLQGQVPNPDTPPEVSLYLQAADVNEQNRWVSAIRKACLCNREMRPVYHPGSFKKTKWTCCGTTSSFEPGCSQCHCGITIGDWRDPLDPELDAQVIFTQFHQGKSTIIKKYLPGGDDISGSTREGSISPTSLSSSGAISLQTDEHEVGGAAALSQSHNEMEGASRKLLSVLDELSYYHSQIHVS